MRTIRNCKFELIRIIACIFVLGCHTMWMWGSGWGFKGLDLPGLEGVYVSIIDTVFFYANPIFFMLSGKFALQKYDYSTDSNYYVFYLKKLAYLIIPLFVYMFFISAYNLKMEAGNYSGLLRYFLLDVIADHNLSHLWFMYVLLGNILMTPFTSQIFSNISKGGALIFISIIFLTNCANAFSPYFFSTSFSSWVNPFVGWTMYFYLGACVDKIFTDKKSIKILTILGVVGFIVFQLKKFNACYLESFYFQPSFVFQVLMVYVLLSNLNLNFGEKTSNEIRFLGNQSFGIYLIHYPIVFLLRDVLLCPSWCPLFLFQFFYMLVIFLVSLALNWIIDKFLFKLIQNKLEKLIPLIS